MTPCTGNVDCWGFGGFEKIQWVEFLPPKKKVDFRSSPRPCSGCRTWWGADGKVSRERLCISLLMSKNPFNSKVIKSFVPELRSRKCFCVSRFLCALWTFYIYLTYSWMAMLQKDTRLETQINYIMIWAPPVMQWLTCLAKEFDSHASHTFSFVLNKGIIALWLFHTSQKHSAQMQSDWNDLFFFLPLGRTQVY